MAPYLINGKEAQGEDYAEAIEALPSAEDHPAEVCVETADNRALTVCNWPGGRFLLIDRMSDGSGCRSPALSKEQAKAVVVSVLNGDEWRKGLQWELGGQATKYARRRMLAVLLVAATLVALPMWRSGCGVDSPPPTRQVVEPKDLAGTWYYRGVAPGTVCEITLNPDNTYLLIHHRSSTASTNTGRWGLVPRDPSQSLWLYPFYASSISGRGAVGPVAAVGWRVTSVSSNLVAPFGGDSLDPHQWAVLSRAAVEPLPEATAVGAAKGWLGVVAALTVVVCVSIGLLLWRASTELRAGKRDWSSESSVASAVLPQIQRLRGDHLSGAPVPTRHALAHRWLVATARRFVAQFPYFRKPEDPDAATPHGTPDHTTPKSKS